MKISKFSVHGLFDQFNHDISFAPDERITIMIAPNGFGKTMILRILDQLFNRSIRRLETIPFEEVVIAFDDGSMLEVNRVINQRHSRRHRGRLVLELKDSDSGEIQERYEVTDRIDKDDVPFPIHAIGDIIPELGQIGPEEWINVRTNEVLDLEDVIREYADELPFGFGKSEEFLDLPVWLREMRKAIPVRFIGTERLMHPPAYQSRIARARRNYFDTEFSTERTVKQYSQELARMVQQTLTEYGTLSQSLDRTFPARVVEEPTSLAPSVDDLRGQLAEVEDKRARIVEAGLLVQQEEELRVPVIDAVDESRKAVLAVYAKDALKKLSVFDDLYNRVNVLKTIANTRFIYKRVSVSSSGLEVAGWDGSNLDLETLSSGEQHELVLLYDLLFGMAKNSLVLIDEPELSLHVAWQHEVLSDLQKMADLSDFRALLATHSPQIIGDRWDLTVELKGPVI